MRRFTDTHVFRTEVFSLGIDNETAGYYLSTPISGVSGAVEFETCYAISEAEYRRFVDNPPLAIPFIEDCRMGREEKRRLA